MANVARVEVETSDGSTYRISKNIRNALGYIHFEGDDEEIAAAKAGIQARTLREKRNEKHIIKLEKDMLAARQRGVVPRAWNEVERIAFKGGADKDRLAAATKLLEYTLGKPGSDTGGNAGPAQYVLIGQAFFNQVPGTNGVFDTIEGASKRLE